MIINSKDNKKVKQWLKYHKKKYRDQDKCFIVEGEHLIQEALAANALECIVVRENFECNYQCDQIYYVSNEIMDRLCVSVSKSNMIGICHQSISNINTYQRVILLDNVQDPGNVGTIIRSAYSFGFDAVILGNNCCDAYNEKCIASTQGALFHLPIIRMDILEAIDLLKANQVKVYGTSLQESHFLQDIKISDKMAIVVGNEGSGVSDEVLANCDANIKIEMSNFESLNVAIAASICMYTLRK